MLLVARCCTLSVTALAKTLKVRVLARIARAAARRSVRFRCPSSVAVLARALARRALRLAGNAVGARRGALRRHRLAGRTRVAAAFSRGALKAPCCATSALPRARLAKFAGNALLAARRCCGRRVPA